MMLLSEKLKILRSLEGSLRGLNRPLTKSEVVRLMKDELDLSISEAYLSQLESGKRQHMTANSRELLARFFKVHPGYLVTDPEGFGTELTLLARTESSLDDWLRAGALSIAPEDAVLSDALGAVADCDHTRELFLVMAALARQPALLARLLTALGLGGEWSDSEKSGSSEEETK